MFTPLPSLVLGAKLRGGLQWKVVKLHGHPTALWGAKWLVLLPPFQDLSISVNTLVIGLGCCSTRGNYGEASGA